MKQGDTHKDGKTAVRGAARRSSQPLAAARRALRQVNHIGGRSSTRYGRKR